MSLSGTGMSEMSYKRPRRSIRSDPLSLNPAVIAAGSTETVDVGMVRYVAERIGYDAEECIQKALEDKEIEMYMPSGGYRDFDTYRLTAKGRKEADDHLRSVFRRSAEMARREREEELAGTAWYMGLPPAAPPAPPAAPPAPPPGEGAPREATAAAAAAGRQAPAPPAP